MHCAKSIENISIIVIIGYVETSAFYVVSTKIKVNY